MAKRVTVVLSQGQSNNPEKRALEENLVASLLFERGVEVAIIPHLYDLKPDGTGMLCLQGLMGDFIVVSWLFPRAAHWILDRNGIAGQKGNVLLKSPSDEEEDFDEDEAEAQAEPVESKGIGSVQASKRKIYCLDLRCSNDVNAFVKEVQRIRDEATVETVALLGWLGGQPKPAQVERFLEPTRTSEQPAEPMPVIDPSAKAIEPLRITENTGRRWYPVIDYSRCTNCMECLDFCLFGVYGTDKVERILVEQPDNCKKGCPACSRVCPENAIIFPQHKTPTIAGSDEQVATGLKIDLSKLFGAPDALEVAVLERDRELVADGRDAVGMAIGVPKRQASKSTEARDELDDLMDKLDDLSL